MADRRATTTETSGNGIIIGILLAVVVAVGAYFFLKSESGVNMADTSLEAPADTNAPAVAPAAGDTATDAAPAPAAQ